MSGNLRYYCENCKKYFEISEQYYHKENCRGILKKDAFISDFEHKEKSNYLNKNETIKIKNNENYYKLKEGTMTFGKNNQKFISDSKEINSSPQVNLTNSLQNNKDEFSLTLKKKDTKNNFESTLKNTNNNDIAFNQSGSFKKNDNMSNLKSTFSNNNYNSSNHNLTDNTNSNNNSNTGSFLKNKNPFLQNQIQIKEYDENDKITKEEK